MKCINRIQGLKVKAYAKYLTLWASLSTQISQNKRVDLGALGSHHLEHFFGCIRRVSRGYNSVDQFVNRC